MSLARVFLGSLLSGIGEGTNNYLKGQQELSAEERKMKADERKLRTEYALREMEKQKYPEKSGLQREYEFVQSAPEPERAAIMNLKAAGSPYYYGRGGLPGLKIEKPEGDEEKYSRLQGRIRQGGRTALNPEEQNWYEGYHLKKQADKAGHQKKIQEYQDMQ